MVPVRVRMTCKSKKFAFGLHAAIENKFSAYSISPLLSVLDVLYLTFVSSFPMNSSDDPANKLLDWMFSGTDTRMKPVTVEPAMRDVDSACSVTYFEDEFPMAPWQVK